MNDAGERGTHNNKDTKTFSADKSGFFAGFGIETMLTAHWAVRGEYRYVWLDGDVCAGGNAHQSIPTCRGQTTASST
jgi:opacity protein-like surface antigen